MIGHVSTVKCILNHRVVFYPNVALIKDPVDMISVCNPCESVVGSRKRFFKCVFQIAFFVLWFLIMSGENVITGAKWRGVKVSNENYRDVVGEMR